METYNYKDTSFGSLRHFTENGGIRDIMDDPLVSLCLRHDSQFTGSGMPACQSWAIRSVAFSLATACHLESLDNHSVLNPHALP